jgi:hypothetical protein
LTIAGSMMEPTATTVATDEPEIAANSAQAHAAVPVADHRGAEVDHPLGDPPVRQEVAGQDEERHRHDLELLDAGEQFERDRVERHLAHREQEGEHREAERDADRHAGQHQRDQQTEDDEGVHERSPLFVSPCAWPWAAAEVGLSASTSSSWPSSTPFTP